MPTFIMHVMQFQVMQDFQILIKLATTQYPYAELHT